MSKDKDNSNAPTLEELYPELTDEELAEAEENLRRYVAVVLRIHDRLERKRSATGGDLTREDSCAEMSNERST